LRDSRSKRLNFFFLWHWWFDLFNC